MRYLRNISAKKIKNVRDYSLIEFYSLILTLSIFDKGEKPISKIINQ